MSWLRLTGTGRSAQALQRLQILETALEQLDRALSKVENGIVTTSTRVLGKVDKRNSSGKAWPKWSFVMKAYDVAVDQQLSGAEISTDVLRHVQLVGVELSCCFHFKQKDSQSYHFCIGSSHLGWIHAFSQSAANSSETQYLLLASTLRFYLIFLIRSFIITILCCSSANVSGPGIPANN